MPAVPPHGLIPARPGRADAEATEVTPAIGGYDDDGDGPSGEVLTANLVHRPTGQPMLIALFSLVILLLVVVPGYVVIKAGASNPAFAAMDSLGVPAWAQGEKHDDSIYSRFCIQECQISERDAVSTHTAAETEAAYVDKLRSAGWSQLSIANCAIKASGSYTCWTLDARELDLWVRPSTCTMPAPPPNRTGIPDGEPTSSASSTGQCDPTSVQIKIFDQIERSRVRPTTSG